MEEESSLVSSALSPGRETSLRLVPRSRVLTREASARSRPGQEASSHSLPSSSSGTKEREGGRRRERERECVGRWRARELIMNGSNGLNNGTNYTMSGGGEGLGSLSRDERRAKRKELKVELEKVKRDLQRVEMKISKKASKKQGSKYDDGKRGIKRKSSETGKTPASPEGMTREARKQVMLKERHRRVQSLWGQCGTILKQLKGNRNAWPFHKPVDWQTLNIPDYPNIVKNPIDMSTISEKLGGWDGKDHRNRDYKSPLEFRDDMRLIFDNCKLYNPVGSDVRIMGDGLADAFEKKWQNSNLEGKFANELEMQKIEEEDLKNFVSYRGKHQKQAAQVSSQIHHLESELNKMKQQLAGGGKRAKTSGGEDPNAEMTFEEKRKLSVNLGILPAEKLGRVVQIINEGPSKIDNSEEEIELDIDKLDNQTLWRLNKYVTSCLKGAKKASHQDKIQRMQQQQETARKLEDVNATLASRSAGGPSTDFSPVSSKRNADEADKGSDSSGTFALHCLAGLLPCWPHSFALRCLCLSVLTSLSLSLSLSLLVVAIFSFCVCVFDSQIPRASQPRVLARMAT